MNDVNTHWVDHSEQLTDTTTQQELRPIRVNNTGQLERYHEGYWQSVTSDIDSTGP